MARCRRREFLRRAGMAATAWTAGCGEASEPYDGPPPFNILFISADDMGWKSTPAYGNGQLSCPAFDRMAAEGVVLSHAFNASSSCSSSRACFATGQYVQTHGVTGLVHLYPETSLGGADETVASFLCDAGFRTAVYGKFHISVDDVSVVGYERRLSSRNGKANGYGDIEPALDFIDRHRRDPWYLEVNLVQTHLRADGTYDKAEDYPVDVDALELLPWWTMPDWPEVREMAAGYFSQVLVTDAMVGQLLDRLDEHGLAEDTLVVFVSDNGIPWPGNKKTLYDRGIGSPLMFRWPAQLPPGRRSSALVSTVDIAPTLLDAAGLPISSRMAGGSLLPLLEGTTEHGRNAVFAAIDRHRDYLPTRAVRTPRYKYVRNLHDSPVGLGQLEQFPWAQAICAMPNQPWLRPRVEAELFDLEEDPDEQNNLALEPELAPIRDELEDLLRAHMEAVDDPYAGAV